MRNRTRLFIVNLERVATDRPATGKIASKVLGSMHRYAWYALQYDIVVMSRQPDEAFLGYLTLFGIKPEQIFVPKGLDLENLSILDGFNDPELRRLVRDTDVESYVPCANLARHVAAAGGHYRLCSNADSITQANAKHCYRRFAPGWLSTPPGQLHQGVNKIAEAAHSRIQNREPTMIRYTSMGGGLGNHTFHPDEHTGITPAAIAASIGQNHPDADTAEALVEDYIPLQQTYGVAFGPRHHRYSTLQITRKLGFYGCWIPCPSWIGPSWWLWLVARTVQWKLRRIGYRGPAQTDLGTAANRKRYGFEINARFTGGLHANLIARQLWGRFRRRQIVIRSMDVVWLQTPLTFEQAHKRLDAAGILATPTSPFGVVISIPPDGNTIGLVSFGRGRGRNGYRQAEQLYRLAHDILGGDATRNTEDYPLFA